MVEALGLKADIPAVIPPPAPCHSFSGRHAGADVHVVCFGEAVAGLGSACRSFEPSGSR